MSGIPEEWETLPSYFQVCNAYASYVLKCVEQLKTGEYVFPRDMVRDLQKYFVPSCVDIAIVLLLAVAWTATRHFLTECLFKPVGKKLELVPKSLDKMPESAWKLMFYVFSWTLTVYIVVFRRRFFQRPSTVWDDWNIDSPVPFDLYALYAVQCSFYLHSLYTTAFVDTWRKDSLLMLVHHVMTLILLVLSYFVKAHNVGSLVLVFHDGCDVILEFTKLQVYFKFQKGKLIRIHDVLSNVGFVCFSCTWFLSRLYWYPLKGLYVSASLLEHNADLPFGLLLNTLLWVLLLMNIYWFLLIIVLVVRVARGELKELDDTREYDVLERIENKPHKKTVSLQNGDVRKSENGTSVRHENGSSVLVGREVRNLSHVRTRSVVLSNGSTSCVD